MFRTLALAAWLVILAGAAWSDTMPDNIVALQVTDARAWTFTRQGGYQGRPDRRALFGIVHPWAPAAAGDSGMLEREVTLPAGWKPPFRLRLYCVDDYMSDAWRPKPDDWLGGEGFTGHRFKQVLVDGQVVWESDVADAEGPRVQTRFEVDLTGRCTPGKPFRLGLRVLDQVGTDVKLPQDFHHTGTTETQAEKPGDPARFMTHVYWGDVLLLRGRVSREALAPFERRPSEASVETVHAKRWPLAPFGVVKRGPASLMLEMAGAIPRAGFPVTCGVPLPAGAVTRLDQIALRDPSGKPTPVQASALNRWQDGSLRWVLLDFEAPAEAGPWRLEFGKPERAPAPPQPVRVRRSGGTLRIATGAIGIVMGEERSHLLDRIVFAGAREPIAGPLTGEVVVRRGRRDVRYAPQAAKIEVTASGPLRATVEMTGRIVNPDDAKDALGRFVFRLNAYAGQPFVRVFYRIFNDTDGTLHIKRFGLNLAVAGKPQAVWSGDARNLQPATDVTIAQTAADAFSVGQVGEGQQSQGWIAQASDRGAVVMAVRHFWQLFPKALRAGADGMGADLFAPTEQVRYHEPVPGEAKRHELLLAFLGPGSTPADAAALVNAFARPPRLFSSQWFCDSGGLGYAAPHSDAQFPELHEYMVKTYGDVGPTVLNGAPGIRNFPDAAYFAGKPGDWRNNYYDIMQGCLSEYLIGGDPRWFDRGEDQCLHVMDTDICHGRPDHPNWRGVLYGPSTNHTSGWWSAMLRAEGMDTYYRLSGDPDAREAFLDAADFIARERAGIGSVSVRDHAGALITLVRAYDETWEPKYLEAARRLAHDAMSRIDRRRGCYSEVHGNYNYRGNIPWMVAQLMEPMYLYYRQSGDLDAANALVGLAESMIAENTSDEGPGDFFGYSHNPHYKKTSNYNVLIAPAMGYAWELTGDAAFAESMRDAYRRTVAEKTVNWVANCYWNTPTLLYYLREFLVLWVCPMWGQAPSPVHQQRRESGADTAGGGCATSRDTLALMQEVL